ncbi:MAG: PhnD/SsuA/transferrin family substrate-binding protein [Myxococcota bacterium]
MVIFDPQANVQQMIGATRSLVEHFAQSGIVLSVQPVANVETFNTVVKESELALVADSYGSRREYKLSPLFVASRSGKTSYQQRFYAGPKAEQELTTVAMVVPTEELESARAALRGIAGKQLAKRWRIIRVPKDIDALLAVAFGQVDACVASETGVQVLTQINPGAIQALKELGRLEPTPLPSLCAREGLSREKIAAVRQAVEGLTNSKPGRQAMAQLGFDGWVKKGGRR